MPRQTGAGARCGRWLVTAKAGCRPKLSVMIAVGPALEVNNGQDRGQDRCKRPKQKANLARETKVKVKPGAGDQD